MHTCIHHRLQKTFWWCWFYRQYYTLQRQMADLILTQSWQILGNAYYILWKSSVNKYCGYQQHGVSVSDSVSKSFRLAFPNQVQTRGLMTPVTVNGAFGLIGTCFIPAPASRDASLFISRSFLCTDVLPAGGKAGQVYGISLPFWRCRTQSSTIKEHLGNVNVVCVCLGRFEGVGGSA